MINKSEDTKMIRGWTHSINKIAELFSWSFVSYPNYELIYSLSLKTPAESMYVVENTRHIR